MNNMKYKVNKSEILLIDSFMKSDYFNELIVFDNEHSQNITFEIAQPEKSEKISKVGFSNLRWVEAAWTWEKGEKV